MQGFRKLSNGSLFVPKKTPYPPAPEGYCQDDSRPWMYHPILIDCVHRFDKSEKLPCGMTERIIECGFYDREATVTECFSCGGKPKSEVSEEAEL